MATNFTKKDAYKETARIDALTPEKRSPAGKTGLASADSLKDVQGKLKDLGLRINALSAELGKVIAQNHALKNPKQAPQSSDTPKPGKPGG